MRAVVYTRVSTEGQEARGHSLDEQKRMCESYIEMQGWKLVGHYTDTGSGGAVEHRQGYTTMLEDMGEKWDAVVAYKLDRFHRNTMNAIEFVDHLGKNDCHIACISEQMDTSTVQGRFFYIVFAALAELRRNEIKERVKMGMQGARAKGLWLGSPPYGYDMSVEVDDAGIRKQKGILVVNEKEATVIEAMFKILDSGGDITDIINWCAENGHKSRTGRAVWHRSSISKIIDRRNLYETGSVLVDGVEISGVQPSILKSNRDTTEEE
tara:strand:+ start:2400 stop:3197 length:798 start_codon:yes stop_codon:yes gene_type:complete